LSSRPSTSTTTTGWIDRKEGTTKGLTAEVNDIADDVRSIVDEAGGNSTTTCWGAQLDQSRSRL
jgi:hypothetical protein